MKKNPLLRIERLSVDFKTKHGPVKAVEKIDLEVEKGSITCIVGESGSGKTVTSLAVMNLLPENAVIRSGAIYFKGENLLENSSKQMNSIRGNSIGMIFQDPMSSLDPVYRCGQQIEEAIRIHEQVREKAELKKRVITLLKSVHLQEPERIYSSYPHELSGGLCQRVSIAMALANRPDLLIADEPTTALDVTTQTQILQLINEIKNQYHMSILFITHDLGVVAQIADRVVVMKKGEVVEKGDVYEIFVQPRSEYTKKLVELMPKLKTKVSDN